MCVWHKADELACGLMWSVCLHTDQLRERPSTPPSSMEAASASTSTVPRQSDAGGVMLLSRHLDFLAGVLSLDSAASAAAPATHVVASTAQLVLDAVLRRLQRQRDDDDDDDVISHSAALHAVDTVARVCDVTDDAICDAVRRFARDVVENIINDHHLNQVLVN